MKYRYCLAIRNIRSLKVAQSLFIIYYITVRNIEQLMVNWLILLVPYFFELREIKRQKVIDGT